MRENIPQNGFHTAADQAYNIISKKILEGEFEPGSKLSRRKMAEVTGVSVIPVIEALNRLEEDGLVESKPKWGSFVTVPTREKVKDMYILREAIECQIARILAEQIKPEQEEELRKMAKEVDSTAYNANTYPDISKTHYRFHSKLAAFTGYNSLINGLRRINLFWILCKAISSTRERAPYPKVWHELLLDSILSGDPDEAERMMRIHVNDSLKPILEDIEKLQ